VAVGPPDGVAVVDGVAVAVGLVPATRPEGSVDEPGTAVGAVIVVGVRDGIRVGATVELGGSTVRVTVGVPTGASVGAGRMSR
jgi:hypothetical protein